MPRRSSPPRRAMPAPTTSTSPRMSTSTRVVKSLADRRDVGTRPAMRPGARLRLDRRGRPRQIVRRHPIDLDARRRAAAVPDQRVQVQPHLVDRRPDQRVLQPVRGDRRRQDARGAAARRARGVLARRRRLRGVQHLGRARHAVRDAARRGRDPQLQDGPLSRAPRRHQDTDHRPAAVEATRPVEGIARGRDPDHLSRRRADLRDRIGHPQRAADAGDVRPQGLRQRGQRRATVGHPADHRRRDLHDGRPACARASCRNAASCARSSVRCPTSSPTASVRSTSAAKKSPPSSSVTSNANGLRRSPGASSGWPGWSASPPRRRRARCCRARSRRASR